MEDLDGARRRQHDRPQARPGDSDHGGPKLAGSCRGRGPDGVVNIIPGPGPGTGEELVTNPLVDKVSFTGSTEVGKQIMQMAANTVKKCTLELGGKGPQIVLDDADLDLAVDGVLYGIFFHSGQVCIAGSRLLLSEATTTRSWSACSTASARSAWDPPPTRRARWVRSSARSSSTRSWATSTSARRRARPSKAGGVRLTRDGLDAGFFIAPTIFDDVTPDMTIAREEIFGPVLSVLTYTDEDDAVRLANDSDYGLAAAVWGSPGHAP
jgi:aldehyde dehydrogenase (NAD+)